MLLKKCYFNKAYNRLKAVDKQNDPCYYYEKLGGGKRYVLYHYPTQTKIACILSKVQAHFAMCLLSDKEKITFFRYC